MSRQRRKGTDYENHLRDKYLRRIWPSADRAPLRGTADRGDFDNVGGFVVEAKKRNKWDLPAWMRSTQKKVPPTEHPDAWMIWFAGDKRKGELTGDYVVMPATLATRLLLSDLIATDYTDEKEVDE